MRPSRYSSVQHVTVVHVLFDVCVRLPCFFFHRVSHECFWIEAFATGLSCTHKASANEHTKRLTSLVSRPCRFLLREFALVLGEEVRGEEERRVGPVLLLSRLGSSGRSESVLVGAQF